MRCAAALSTHPVPSQATGDVIADLLEYGSAPPDLLLVVATPEFSGAADDIILTMTSLLQPGNLLFVVSAGILAAGSEVTAGPGLGLWALWSGTLGGDSVRLVTLGRGEVQFDEEEQEAFGHSRAVVLLGDPGADDVTTILDDVVSLLPHHEVSGGLLSAARGSVRIIDASGRSHPAVALCLQTVPATAVLGHGSVPLSDAMTATTVVGSRLSEIDFRPALEVAREIIDRQAPEAKARTARDLAVAVHSPQDDSIRDVHRVLGADQTMRALALTSEIPVGASISFHLQDRESGLGGLDEALGGPRARGALIFSCSDLDPGSEREGTGELGHLVEVLGTAAFCGLRVSTVIGCAGGEVGLRQAPLSATILGRDHH